jgi:hypothetical protein
MHGKVRSAWALMLYRSIAWWGVLVACANPASARTELGLGLVDEIEGDRTEIATLAWVTEQRHPWEAMIGHIHGRDGGHGVYSPSVTFMALSKRLTWRDFFVASGVAITDADNDVLSGVGQFMSTLGWRRKDWAVSLRHLSNANTGGRNRGETFLLVTYAW